MECFWCLFRHRQPDGHRHQQDPPILYLYIIADDGLAYYYLHGIGFLAQYAQVHDGGEKKSVVLFVMKAERVLQLRHP